MTRAEARLPRWLRWLNTFLAGAALGLCAGAALPLWLGASAVDSSWYPLIPAFCMLLVLPGYALEAAVRLWRITQRLGSTPAGLQDVRSP